jgi:thiol:disulfide interchange protein
LRRPLTCAAAALLLWVAAAGSGCAPAPEGGAGIDWVKNHAEGLRRAAESGKPALVYFTADWCAPCVELKKYIWPERSVVEASRKLVMIYVDVDEDPGTFAAYRVRGIPAIFFLTPEGERAMAFTGDRSAANLSRQMKSAADSFSR